MYLCLTGIAVGFRHLMQALGQRRGSRIARGLCDAVAHQASAVDERHARSRRRGARIEHPARVSPVTAVDATLCRML